jgi:hypothetical protein
MRMVSDKVYEDTRIRLAIVAKRKMTGVDPGLDFHSTVVRVLLLLLFYSIISFRFCAVYTKIKGMSLHVSFTCLVGRVFLVYTTRRFCPSTRPASSKLERDQTTRQIKCRCTNSFGIYTSTVRAASATFIHTTTTTKKRKRFFLFRSSGVV